MRVSGYRPQNAWLQRELDERWQRWLTSCLAGAAALIVVLAGIVGPRQTTVRLRYEIAQKKEEVSELEREHRNLLLLRERLTSPAALAAELPALGLTQVPPDRVLYLAADGSLVDSAALDAQTGPPEDAR